MSTNKWTTINHKKTAYKPPQQREPPQLSFDELYPNTLNSSVKKPVALPACSYSKMLIDSTTSVSKPVEIKNDAMPRTTTFSGIPVRLVVRDLILPEDNFDYSKIMFPPCNNYRKAIQKKQHDNGTMSSCFGLSYEDEHQEAYEAVDDYETNDDDWQNETDDQEFNADIYG